MCLFYSYQLEQTNESVIITVDTQKQLLKSSDVITEVVDGVCKITILLGEWICKLKLGKHLALLLYSLSHVAS